MITRLKQTPALYLVGFMGSGKTTIGRRLASHLGWRFVDLDDDIETAQGMSIPRIFEELGEGVFRQVEAGALQRRVMEIRRGVPTVLALGGGTFAEPGNYETVEGHGVSVWLDCPLEIARQRVAPEGNRPLARDPGRFAELYQARQSAYARADYRVDASSDDPAVAVEAILRLPLFS